MPANWPLPAAHDAAHLFHPPWRDRLECRGPAAGAGRYRHQCERPAAGRAQRPPAGRADRTAGRLRLHRQPAASAPARPWSGCAGRWASIRSPTAPISASSRCISAPGRVSPSPSSRPTGRARPRRAAGTNGISVRPADRARATRCSKSGSPPGSSELSRPTVCVTHGGVVRVLFRLFGGLGEQKAAALPVPQDRLLRFRDGELVWL